MCTLSIQQQQLTRNVAVIVDGIRVGTHGQQLLHRLHVPEVGGQGKRSIAGARSGLERGLTNHQANNRNGGRGVATASST